ncbi:MAG: hypothetical protein NT092_11920 [Bacteroidia bacterium]|nr:hypothetical protein [Bacteroidia bacterium]
MKKFIVLLIIATGLLVLSCSEKKSDRFVFLTTPVWTTDTLLSDGVDASGPLQLLGKFKGDARFYEDGTGYFGKYKGEWMFSVDEKNLTIMTDSLPIPIVADIRELTKSSLKITTSVPNPLNLTDPFDIRMTFKAR